MKTFGNKKEEICFDSTIIQGQYNLEGGRWSSTGLNMYFHFKAGSNFRTSSFTT